MKRRNLVVLTPADPDDEVGYTVTVPDLPGCITEGDTLEQALQRAKEVIQLFVETVEEDGLPVPAPARTIDEATLERGQLVTTVDLSVPTAIAS